MFLSKQAKTHLLLKLSRFIVWDSAKLLLTSTPWAAADQGFLHRKWIRLQGIAPVLGVWWSPVLAGCQLSLMTMFLLIGDHGMKQGGWNPRLEIRKVGRYLLHALFLSWLFPDYYYIPWLRLALFSLRHGLSSTAAVWSARRKPWNVSTWKCWFWMWMNIKEIFTMSFHLWFTGGLHSSHFWAKSIILR